MKAKSPPVITFRPNDPLQDFYEDREGNRYSVARLIDDTKKLKPFKCPVAALSLAGKIWDGKDIAYLAFHVKKVNEADLSKPIILAWDGEIADGRHRLIKALTKGHRYIKAVRMTWKIEPCRPAP